MKVQIGQITIGDVTILVFNETYPSGKHHITWELSDGSEGGDLDTLEEVIQAVNDQLHS